MSQISTESYTYNNDIGSVHSNNSLPASEELNYDTTDMLYSWELSARFNQISRGVPKFDDLHLLQANSGGGVAGKHENYYVDDHLVHPFEEFQFKSVVTTTAPSSSSAGKKQHQYVSALDELLAHQFSKECQINSRSHDHHSDESQSSFHHIFPSAVAQNLIQSKLMQCPDRPYHLMKTHITFQLETELDGSQLQPETKEDPLKAEETTDSPENQKQLSLLDNWNYQNIEYIIDVVSSYLNTFSEYDFSYFPKLFLWKGKYLQGSSCCLINIHLYKDSKNIDTNDMNGDQATRIEKYIVEANRISGDSKPFHEFFKEFKKLISNHFHGMSTGGGVNEIASSPDSNSSSFDQDDYFYANGGGFLCSSNSALNSPSFQNSSRPFSPSATTNNNNAPLPSPCRSINCQDFHKSIEPILKMATCIYYEVKLEAAKMLCDISSCEEFYARTDYKCIDNIFKAIETLILHHDGFLTVKEQAIVAFASFINESNYNKEILNRMVKSPVLFVLFQLINHSVQDAISYEILQMRRESARVLSILASHDAKQLLATFESQQITNHVLNKWFDSIDCMKDQRMKIYAMKMRDTLTALM